jgi:hypothetical protein
MTLTKIVSGGQTGVDRGALEGALVAGFPCGGWCPKDRNAEDGPIPARYPMTLLAGGGYRQGTVKNVLDRGWHRDFVQSVAQRRHPLYA